MPRDAGEVGQIAVSELAALAPVLANLPAEERGIIEDALVAAEKALAALVRAVEGLGPSW
jgi:hypothetical protein